MTRIAEQLAYRVRLGLATAAVAAIGGLGVATDGANASVRARPGPGPALTTSPRSLAGALSCPRGVRGDRGSVLLVPGAGGDPAIAYPAGLERLLRVNHYAVCDLSLPHAGFADFQIQAEYVVASIRTMATRSGRRVNVIGVSQGGALPRWALKWWPDLRSLVGDVIGLAPGNHGNGPTLAALCAFPCPPTMRQGVPGSRYLSALNRGDETPGRLSYSSIFSATDEKVPPPSPTLRGEGDDSNTRLQTICPGRRVDHGSVAYDAVAIALALDALRHAGPARAGRIPRSTCARKYARFVDQAEFDRDATVGAAYVAANYGSAGLSVVEPELRSYATRPAPQPRAILRIRPRRLQAARRTVISFRAYGTSGGEHWPLRGARIRIAGKTVETDAAGRASLRLRVPHPGVLHVRLAAPGLPRTSGPLSVQK
jgi:hypothetical protein